ncbi:exodeoxyribonuclease VII small subunit [Epidermidibacterium keratini]|uniref:Exodeoxyribonuclease 7 small subunit n=1 Tax=Epidermidibacterium keratini TaxID=1891644 RepID=A0A7L4YKU0_9ACTN|nr:exodeoxyribonuclease VII small subunit [Epidermidibacterium keratini]QHB99681.1 exodeoxyribonuclease VII small subunit [Epidermidibacterium keratini]
MTESTKLTYEQAREALGEVVQKLEAGGISLEESIALWERGEQLAAECQRLLDGAQARLDEAIERSEQAGFDEDESDHG